MATRRVEDKNRLDFFALCMSALGQKRTFRRAIGMSALAPKADYGCPPWANSGHAAKSQRTPANWRPYGIFQTAVSMRWHLGHTKVSSSWPGRSGSTPNSTVAVPHSEQFCRPMELEFGATTKGTRSFVSDVTRLHRVLHLEGDAPPVIWFKSGGPNPFRCQDLVPTVAVSAIGPKRTSRFRSFGPWNLSVEEYLTWGLHLRRGALSQSINGSN